MILASLAIGACIVTAVHDGDTATLKCDGRSAPVTLRIMEIDAPEMQAFSWKTQPYATESRDALRALCLNQPATPQLIRYDARTARWVGRLTCSGTDVATAQVSNGLAWAFMASKRSKIPALQEQAHAAGKGLWADPNPVQPAVWRKGAAC